MQKISSILIKKLFQLNYKFYQIIGIDAGKSNKYCPKSERVPGELAPAYPVLSEQNLPTGMYCPTGLDGSKKVDSELPLEAPLYFNKHNKQLQSDC